MMVESGRGRLKTNSHRSEDAKGAFQTDPHGLEGLVVGCLDTHENRDVVCGCASATRLIRLDVVLVAAPTGVVTPQGCHTTRGLSVALRLLDHHGTNAGRETHLLDAGSVNRVDIVPEDALALFSDCQ